MPELETLLNEHYADLVRAAYLLSGDLPAAEDVVHDVVLRLLPQWPEIGGRVANPGAYLRKAVFHEYLVARRRRRSWQLNSLEDGSHPAVPPPSTLEDREELWPLIRRLPQRQAAAIVLRYYSDLQFQEIAEILGCRPATARSLVRRGLVTIRRCISPTSAFRS